MLQKYFFGNKKNRKGTAKATLKIEKYEFYIFTENISPAYNSMQVVLSCKNALILQKNN